MLPCQHILSDPVGPHVFLTLQARFCVARRRRPLPAEDRAHDLVPDLVCLFSSASAIASCAGRRTRASTPVALAPHAQNGRRAGVPRIHRGNLTRRFGIGGRAPGDRHRIGLSWGRRCRGVASAGRPRRTRPRSQTSARWRVLPNRAARWSGNSFAGSPARRARCKTRDSTGREHGSTRWCGAPELVKRRHVSAGAPSARAPLRETAYRHLGKRRGGSTSPPPRDQAPHKR